MPDLKLALGALLLACAGCALLDPQVASMAAADSALSDALSATRAPQAEQRSALARAQQAFTSDPAPVNRLRLAALLALVAPPLRDEGRAAELLGPIADPGMPGVGRTAAVLAAELAEQQRLAREVDRLARESERTARERERLDRERDKREEALREQVEALRDIERNIREREEKLRRGQR
jgi:hypothetical protein